MKKLCVLGSLNIDMTLTVPRFNQPGETVTADSLAIYTGGKGGNQAVAAARLGAQVCMVGCLGGDANGKMYRDRLSEEGADVSGVRLVDGVPTGTAFIEVAPSGENRIAVARGANECLTVEVVRTEEAVIAGADVFLCQMENPMDAIEEGMRLAKKHGCAVIFDPAPAKPVPDSMLALCDVVTPNETELAILTGMPVDTEEQAVAAARTLIARGAKMVLNKRGRAGALLVTAEESRAVPGFKVNAVDTTAAGDSFNAGLGVGLLMGMSMDDAIRLANAVGALSTTRAGAQPAMPSMAEAQALMG